MKIKTVYFMSLCSVAILGSHPPEKDPAGTQKAVLAPVASKLDIVTTVKPVQDIIMGYIGQYMLSHEIESNKSIIKFALGSDAITALRYGYYGYELTTWDLHTGRKLHSIPVQKVGSDSGEEFRLGFNILFSPDSTYFMTFNSDHTVINSCICNERALFTCYDTRTGVAHTELSQKIDALAANKNIISWWPLGFTPCGKKIIIACAMLWRTKEGFLDKRSSETVEIDVNKQTIQSIAPHMETGLMSPSGQYIVGGKAFYEDTHCHFDLVHITSLEKTNKTIHTNIPLPLYHDPYRRLYVGQFAFSPSNEKLFALVLFDTDGHSRSGTIFSTKNFDTSSEITMQEAHICNDIGPYEQPMRFIPNSPYLLITRVQTEGKNTYFLMCNALTGIKERLPIESPVSYELNFSLDGRFMAIHSIDQTIQIYQLAEAFLAEKEKK